MTRYSLAVFFLFTHILGQALTFDVEILINDAICAFEGDMTEAEHIYLIIGFFLVKPNSKSAYLRLLLKLCNESLMIFDLFSYFRNVTLHFTPDMSFQLPLDLFA